MNDDELDKIRDRHERADADVRIAWHRCGLHAHDDRGALLAEVEKLRAENERLYNEDTKTRHALKGWAFVCPDGGDEPTHERVAAVVAEIERLREALEDIARGDYSDPMCERTPEQRAREALESGR